jgi:hypothetical protein
MESPEAGLRAGSRDEKPAPGRKAPFPGKPRNPDESLHAHNKNLIAGVTVFQTANCGAQSCEHVQMKTNASSSRPKTPAAIIVLVALSKPSPSVNHITAFGRST